MTTLKVLQHNKWFKVINQIKCVNDFCVHHRLAVISQEVISMVWCLKTLSLNTK